MCNLRDQNSFQDATHICGKLHAADHTTLANFAVGFAYNSELDLSLRDTVVDLFKQNSNNGEEPPKFEADIPSLSGTFIINNNNI